MQDAEQNKVDLKLLMKALLYACALKGIFLILPLVFFALLRYTICEHKFSIGGDTVQRVILHSDLNNFYASVECLYRPSLRGRPVAVVGDPQLRHGIVLAKNYIAKAFGVQTGQPLWMARQACPGIQFVTANYDRYLRYSHLARQIYGRFTDQIESFGLDECWLDVTASAPLFGDGQTIAGEIRSLIRSELGVTASIGVSFNKIFAKLASDLKKPDATIYIPREQMSARIWPLPVETLLFVGPATKNKLRRHGILTIGQLANATPALLQSLLGRVGLQLQRWAKGDDTSPVAHEDAKAWIKSIGNSTTTPRDLVSDDDVKLTLYILCESVAARLRRYEFCCRTVQLWIRDAALISFERQKKLPQPGQTSQELFETAFSLYLEHRPDAPIRSLGVRACDLECTGHRQLSLLPDQVHLEKQSLLEHSIDTLRHRFGHSCIQRGIMLTDSGLSALNPESDHVIHPESFYRHRAG